MKLNCHCGSVEAEINASINKSKDSNKKNPKTHKRKKFDNFINIFS